MKKQIILIRGGETYDSYDDYIASLKAMTVDFKRLTKKGWKEKLADDLGAEAELIMPVMPNGWNAKYLEWKIFFEKLVPYFNDQVIFIGNSLGSIFLVKYLSENVLPKQIMGIFLVGAPYDADGSDYSLADFILPENFEMFTSQCDRAFFYFASDDPVVLPANMEKYKKALPNAHYALLDNRGHFNVAEFPEIEKDIRVVLSRFN